jgi:hypothetical protein
MLRLLVMRIIVSGLLSVPLSSAILVNAEMIEKGGSLEWQLMKQDLPTCSRLSKDGALTLVVD